jgi:peptide chain release factor subunit 1
MSDSEKSASADKDEERAVFLRTLGELKTVTKHGETHVSLYLPPDYSPQAAVDLMTSEIALARNVKSREMRESAKAALRRALTVAQGLGVPHGTLPPTGVAIFTTRTRTWLLTPPAPIASFLYRCGSDFVLEPLDELSADPALYALVVIDYKEATIGLLRGKRIETVVHLDSGIMGKHDAGGQSQRRFERIMENERAGFLVDVLERLKSTLLPLINRCEVDGLLIGGPGMTKAAFAGLVHDTPLAMLLIEPLVDTGYTEEYGLRELVAGAKEQLRATGLARENALVEEFFRGVHTGKATYGKLEVWAAVDRGAADRVLVSPGADEPGLRALARLRGATVTTISDDSESGQRFRQFGGIGAFLRYGGGA